MDPTIGSEQMNCLFGTRQLRLRLAQKNCCISREMMTKKKRRRIRKQTPRRWVLLHLFDYYSNTNNWAKMKASLGKGKSIGEHVALQQRSILPLPKHEGLCCGGNHNKDAPRVFLRDSTSISHSHGLDFVHKDHIVVGLSCLI